MTTGARLRQLTGRALTPIIVVALVAGLYSGYKAFGRALDDAQTGWPVVGSLLPRTDDLNMPPLGDIVSELGATPSGTDQALWRQLLDEAAFTLRSAAAGFAVGAVVGLGLAVLLSRSRRLEHALLPYIVISQTVPLVAIAPIVIIWGRRNFAFLPWEWQDWMSVSLIAAFLTFFPVAVNGLRGLRSPRPEDIELMRSYAAGWAATLWRLRLPSALPYLFAAAKLAATASIVGAIVGEISGGVNGGLGRRILSTSFNYTVAPERLYGAVLAAALLGIAVFVTVGAAERIVLGRQGREAVT